MVHKKRDIKKNKGEIMLEFQKFDKIPRLSRDIVISEKIDGTNAQIVILNEEEISPLIGSSFYACCCLGEINHKYIFAGSRKKWLDTSSNGDNFDFAKWVQANAEGLLKLGEGRHYGEWYGKGIQRNYGLDEKRFALFNVKRWIKKRKLTQLQIDIEDQRPEWQQQLEEGQSFCPDCCEVVPILYEGLFETSSVTLTLKLLEQSGSKTVPGFMNPEGIIIYHKASGQLFKKTIKNDEKPKGNN